MTNAQIDELIRLLQWYYPTFALNQAILQLCYGDLAPYTPEVALESLKEWVRWHSDSPPQLGELAARCCTTTAQRQHAAHALLVLPAVLHPDQATYTQLM